MIQKIVRNIHWVPSYFLWELGKIKRSVIDSAATPKHVFFSICDHFEPYWRNDSKTVARKRISRWHNEYPKIAEKYKDSDGEVLKYSFFYPEEEYTYDDMEALATLCREGYGEVEIHLHHDNDTSDNLRETLLTFKKRLYYDHALLSKDKMSSEISYGFIHGNWALDNSRPDGKRCGVNDEISVLSQTGCYADFTMPSAPDVTQTKIVNNIYYALGNPNQSKSHDKGISAKRGIPQKGLLMVQGPLCLDFMHRKYGVFPRIENSGIVKNNPPTAERVNNWLSCGVHVDGQEDWIFVKIYTHGTQEHIMDMLFDGGHLDNMFSTLIEQTNVWDGCKLHFVSAREMVNIIKAIENGCDAYSLTLRDYRFK